MTKYRVGADIGGTFTDVVLLGEDGAIASVKVASTPPDYSEGVLQGIEAVAQSLRVAVNQISAVSHGHTIATNAILEEKGAKTALITTKGFRDILEIRRLRVPRLYDMYFKKPPTLVPRALRLEVAERLDARGQIVLPLDVESVHQALKTIDRERVQSIVICLLHAYANPIHERQIADILRAKLPDITLTLSSELLPVMKEYERTSTTVINGYVRPVVEGYLRRLASGLKERAIEAPLNVLQSNGGLASSKTAAEKPVLCIESGPAAGVMGAVHLGRCIGLHDLVTLDMGGTTAKASIVEDGRPLQSREYEVGAGLNIGHRLLRGAGHVISVPAIDVAEVGAGGGSIAFIDPSGTLHVGPSSAGSVPGPACYGRGGEAPTVTDANVTLGYLNPSYLLGGAFRLDAEKAKSSIAAQVADRLDRSVVEVAYGIHLLANSNMSRALKAVSSERGRDPRKFTMVAFGGSGPVHAAGLAEMIGVSRIIIPVQPGVFSAVGLLFANMEHHVLKTFYHAFDDIDVEALNRIVGDLKQQGADQLASENIPEEHRQIVAQFDVKYVGQGSEITITVEDDVIGRRTLERVAQEFSIEHEKTFGHRAQIPCQLVNIRIVAKPKLPEKGLPISANAANRAATDGTRRAYFGPVREWVDCTLMTRNELKRSLTSRPLLIEEYDTTTVVPPEWGARIDDWQNIILERLEQ